MNRPIQYFTIHVRMIVIYWEANWEVNQKRIKSTQKKCWFNLPLFSVVPFVVSSFLISNKNFNKKSSLAQKGYTYPILFYPMCEVLTCLTVEIFCYEVIWVSVRGCEDDVCWGNALNQPNELTTVQKGQEIRFGTQETLNGFLFLQRWGADRFLSGRSARNSVKHPFPPENV